MSITSITVNRRKHVSATGFTQDPKLEHRIPTFKELVYDIYDYQRDIISSIFPKRIKCKSPVPIKAIERIYHMGPKLMTFDGMSHSQALQHYIHEGLSVGIRNEFCIPFIFAKKIHMRSNAFQEGYSYIFESIDGLRYMTQSTQQEFNWITVNRQILSNLSFCINQKYNCNLHIALDEATRVHEMTGFKPDHNRDLFTRACDYYINPRLLSLPDFIRCQISTLREYDDKSIEVLLHSDDDSIMAFDPMFAYEIQQAKRIYHGQIEQWVGDFSHEPILGS